MSRVNFFYFFLLSATTGYFGLVYLFFFLMFGAYIGFIQNKSILKDRRNSLILITLFFFIPFFHSNSNVNLFDLILNIFILGSSVLVSQFFFINRKYDKYTITFSLNIFFILYVLITSLLGLSLLDSIKIIFTNSSYHIVFWLLFIFNSISLIEMSYYTDLDKNKSKIFILSITFLAVSLLLQGRSGVLISGSIFLYTIYLLYKKYFYLTLIISLYLYFFVDFYALFEQILADLSTDLYERRFKFSARETIWNCYLDKLKFEDYLFGFNKFDIASNCLYTIDRYDGDSHHIMTESSFLSLLSYTGILGLIYIFFLIVKSIITSRSYKYHAIILICLIFRVFTADYLFFSIFDWFFFVIIFNYNESRKHHYSFSRKVI